MTGVRGGARGYGVRALGLFRPIWGFEFGWTGLGLGLGGLRPGRDNLVLPKLNLSILDEAF